jgi:hypothetical protein
VSSLPAEVRALLPPAQQAGQHVRLEGAPPGLEGGCWRLFHEALEPLYRSGKLGAVVFQFHLSFQPSRQNLEVPGGWWGQGAPVSGITARCERCGNPAFAAGQASTGLAGRTLLAA